MDEASPGFESVLFSTLLADLAGLIWNRGGGQAPDPLETLAEETGSESLESSIETLKEYHSTESRYEEKPLRILAASDSILGGGTSGDGKGEAPLKTIFSSLKIYRNLPPGKDYYHRPSPVRLTDRSLFPTGNPANGAEGYMDLLEPMREDFEKIGSFRGLEFSFIYEALRRYCRFIPARGGGSSLFDRAKLLCAAGSCLYRQTERDRSLLERTEKGKGAPFALIHGDISGVQSFIYSITSKYALKTLKGRSLYLSLLTDNIADYLIDELGLTRANVLFAGGGHLYILSHRGGKEEVDGLRERVNKTLVDHFDTGLYLALDAVDLLGKKLEADMADVWREAAEKTGEWKEKKFAGLLEEEKYYRKIMRPEGEAATNRCVICGSRQGLREMPDAEETLWCKDCRSFRDLSEDLKEFGYLRRPGASEKSYNGLFGKLGGPYEFSARPEGVSWKVNSTRLEEGYLVGSRFIPKGIPTEEGTIKDLDHLSSAGEGAEKIGAVKMDVDSLGRVFTRGLEDRSAARLSTLSSSLSLFFKGYLSRLIEKSFPGSIYLVYSGGDDTFALGHWARIIEFGWEVYRKFREYTAYNPHLTLSAGVAVVDPKLPVSRAAGMAEERLDRAKYGQKPAGEQEEDLNPKNGISLFGKILGWDWRQEGTYNESGRGFLEEWNEEGTEVIEGKSEFELARLLEETLVWLINEKEVPRGLLGKLKGLSGELDSLLARSAETGEIDTPRLWRVKYSLRDYLNSPDPEVREGTDLLVSLLERTVRDNLFKEEESKIKSVKFITVATRWAELLTRKEG